MWDPDTLQRLDPAVRERCEAADLSLDSAWLSEAELEVVPSRSLPLAPSLEDVSTLEDAPILEDQRREALRATG